MCIEKNDKITHATKKLHASLAVYQAISQASKTENYIISLFMESLKFLFSFLYPSVLRVLVYNMVDINIIIFLNTVDY